jgi:hypothetical protein
VRLAKSVDEVAAFAREMLGRTLVTVQTGPAGKQVNRLYVEDGSDIEKEFYLSMLVDRETSRIAYVVSTEGGMDIEKVAHDTPDKIVTLSVDPNGVMAHHGRHIAQALGLPAISPDRPRSSPRNLQRLRCYGHGDAGNQSTRGHEAGRTALPRRQDQFRFQRALSSSGHRETARSHRRG